MNLSPDDPGFCLDDTAEVQWVYVFANGMVAVFDNQGRQIPALQGRRDRAPWGTILSRLSISAELHGISRFDIVLLAAAPGPGSGSPVDNSSADLNTPATHGSMAPPPPAPGA